MNKELINKYKPEFDHWLNEGEILKASWDFEDSKMSAWYKVERNENWNFSNVYDYKFIINDEYAEFRKALAEGKVIESKVRYTISNNSCHYGEELSWSIDTSGKFKGTPDLYRIKPDEPKFKVGDFVTPLNREINCSIWQIDNILSCNTLVSGITMLDPRTIQLWTPVKGEWCWFYDSKSSKSAVISQFKEKCNDKFISNNDMPWECCEPFLNSLPSYLKDN